MVAGKTTAAAALAASLIWALGNNFPPRAWRPGSYCVISGWLSVTLWSSRQGGLTEFPAGFWPAGQAPVRSAREVEVGDW